MNCKVCGAKAKSDLCFRHKPRKAIPKKITKWGLTFNNMRQFGTIQTSSTGKVEMRNFFLEIWNNRPHRCENCREWLGNEPLSYMFDHLLEKSKYPDLRFEKDNIMLVCLECHDNKTRGNITEFVKNRIEKVRNKFGK